MLQRTSRSLTVLVLMTACHQQPEPALPLQVPERISVHDPRQPTMARGPQSPTFVMAGRATTDPPSAVELEEKACAAAPPVISDQAYSYQGEHVLTDADLQASLDRERAAMTHPPRVLCHVYLGAQSIHLAVHGGQSTRAELADLQIALAFRMDAYEGSSFALAVHRNEELLITSGGPIELAAPPVSPRCDGPGFTGWLYGGGELRAFCAARAPSSPAH